MSANRNLKGKCGAREWESDSLMNRISVLLLAFILTKDKGFILWFITIQMEKNQTWLAEYGRQREFLRFRIFAFNFKDILVIS